MAEPAYTLPQATLQEHFYLEAQVLELQRIRVALEALVAAQSNPPPPGEVTLREPEKAPRPRRGEN